MSDSTIRPGMNGSPWLSLVEWFAKVHKAPINCLEDLQGTFLETCLLSE